MYTSCQEISAETRYKKSLALHEELRGEGKGLIFFFLCFCVGSSKVPGTQQAWLDKLDELRELDNQLWLLFSFGSQGTQSQVSRDETLDPG